MEIRILIVEDEPLISEDLSMILANEGYQICGQAYEGTEALSMVKNLSPDLVLLDISLGSPAVNGFDIAEYLNNKYKIPFIFITSFSDNYTLDMAKDLYPEGYIVKPFKKKDILASIGIIAHKIKNRYISPYLSLEDLNKTLKTNITPKEYELLLDLCQGLSNIEISDKHFISLNTVKTHIKRSFVKLKVESRNQIASLLLRK